MSQRSGLLCTVFLASAAIAVICHATGALNALQRDTVDARFSIRGSLAPGRTVIVAVDEKTLADLGVGLPIPRRYYGQALDDVRRAGASAIGIDVQFVGSTDARDDRQLIAAVARDGPVILATHDTSEGPVPVPAGAQRAMGVVSASAAVDTDPDGILRKMLYIAVRLRTLAVAMAARVLDHAVPADGFPSNHAWIDFRGPPGTFRQYSMIDVLRGLVPAAAFAGRPVLIGVTDPLSKDLFPTAISSIPMAGVEVQANALTTILKGFPLGTTPGAVNVLLIILLAAVPAAVSFRAPALYGVLAAGVALLASLGGSQVAFNSGSIVSIPDPILALVLSTVGSIAAESYTQRRQLARLQRAFDLLPSPVSDFFISYRREQSAFVAGALRQELARKFGEASVFVDTAAIGAGQEWPQRICEAVAASRAMLVLIGPMWLACTNGTGGRRLDDPGDWVRLEIEQALGQERTVVVPVLHDGARVPAEDELPDVLRSLARRHAIALTGDDLDAEIDALVASIESGRLRQPQRGPSDPYALGSGSDT